MIRKIFKVFFYNLLILTILIIILELLLGNWFGEKFKNLLISERNINRIYNFDFEHHKGYSIYKRDKFGFRVKNNIDYKEIDILFLGGSTINQKFLNYDNTVVGILNNTVLKKKNMKALNGGVDGMSIIGHLNSFELWLDKIDNLRPKYYVYYIGYNDHLKFPNALDLREMDDLDGGLKIRTILNNRSFIINNLEKLRIYLFLKYNIKIKINQLNKKTIVYFDQRNSKKFLNWIEIKKKHRNLVASEKILYEKFKSDYLILLEKLTKKVENRKAKIIYINQISGEGLNLSQFVIAEAIMEHCAKFKIKCINLAKDSGLNYYDFYDNAHLNNKGALKASNFLKKHFDQIIN